MHTERSDRDAKLDALHDRLTGAVADVVSGDDWRRALEFAARFRSRSFNNTLLIWVQHRDAFEAGRVSAPTPTYVAGFKQWLSMGRYVVKGQSGYQIFAPVTARFASTTPGSDDFVRRLACGEKPASGETVRSRMVGLRVAHVWDVSQTEGGPVPQRPHPRLLQGEAPAGLWDGLAAQVEAQGFTLRRVANAAVIGGANGLTDYTARVVSVRDDMDDAARVKTLAHEFAHVLLHGPDNTDAARHCGVAEVEAESVALMIAGAHGLDTSSYTVPYVASWASGVAGQSPVEVVRATADRVRATAVAVLDRLDTTQAGDGDPPGLDRQTRNRPHTLDPRDTARPVRRVEPSTLGGL